MLDSSARSEALAEVSRYSLREAATLAGALCLVPQNLHCLARLESLAHCCVAGIPQGHRAATRSNAQRLLSVAFMDWAGRGDDHADFPATQGFTFHGGTHVLIGPTPASLHALRAIGVMSTWGDRGLSIFRAQISNLIEFCCQVSGRLSREALLKRNMPMPDSGKLYVPPERSLRRLQAAVAFSGEEWQALLRDNDLAGEDVAPLCACSCAALPDEPPYESYLLAERPFLLVAGEIVVVAPHRIVDALTCHIRTLIARHESRNVLATEFHGFFQRSVERNFEHLRWERVTPWRLATTTPEGTRLSDSLFQWDVNRLAHVVVVTDGCSMDEPEWEARGTRASLVRKNEEYKRLISSATPPVEEVFTILIIAPMVGAKPVAEQTSEAPPEGLVTLSASDLEALCLSLDDVARPAFLGRYVRSMRDYRSSGGQVHAWCELDAIAAWVDYGHRFPSNLNLISVDCGYSRKAREKALLEHDWHSVPSSTKGMLIEVGVVEDPVRPIYGPRYPDADRVQLVVEVSGRFIWFEMSRPDELQGGDWGWFIEFVRMSAYWTAELLNGLLLSDAGESEVLVVEVQPNGDGINSADSGYSIQSNLATRLVVNVSPCFMSNYGTTNEAERRFAASLVGELFKLIGQDVPSVVEKLVERLAPLGPKRMLHAVDSSQVPEYHFAHSLPRPVYVHPADLHRIDNSLLTHPQLSLSSLGKDGREAQGWLNGAVQVLFGILKLELRKFDGSVLLERLMLNNEALLFELAQEELTLASQLACFENSPEFVGRLREAGPRKALAAVATRFLVELVSAGLPTGEDRPGDVDIAYLLALGFCVMSFGATSDVVKYELGTVSIRCDNGKLLVSRGDYDSASGAVREALFTDQLATERRRRTIRRTGSKREPEPPSPWVHSLSQGVAAEWGVTLEELVAFFEEVCALSREKGSPVVRVRETELITRLSANAGIDVPRIQRLIATFSLEPRVDYMSPPSPFRRSDVYPWHFNRSLSYLQRPFLRMSDGSLLFGSAHVYRASRYLLDLMMSGRFKARTLALRAVMSKFTGEAGVEFNDQVAEALRARGMFVQARTSKLGCDRLRGSDGQDLGDIDVIAADLSSKLLFAVECKNMEPDRMPHEVRSDLEALFIGAKRSSSAQEKHLKRVAWVREHLDHVLAALKLPAGDWQVYPLMVISQTMRSPLLGRAKLRVLSLSELNQGAALA